MKVAIIGAGIGGLTIGLVLKNAGIPFKIFEKSVEIKPVGAGLVLGINAMQVYKKLGIHNEILEQSSKIHGMNICSPDFSILSNANIRDFEIKYHLSSVAIHRANLHSILSEAVGFENILLNKKFNKITKNNSQYRLDFEDGFNIDTDFLIAADGINSSVRKQIFGERKLRDSKQICWRGVTDLKLPKEYKNKVTECWGKGTRFGFTEIGNDKIYWYFLINENKRTLNSNLLDYIDEFDDLIKTIIQTTDTNKIFVTKLFDLKPLNHWYKDNICLLGDAAHATTPNLGQGACQAIEDAYVICELLKKNSLQESFKKYPEIRMEKANYIVNTSWKIGKIAQLENPFLIALRNLLIMMTPDSYNYKQFQKIFELDKV